MAAYKHEEYGTGTAHGRRFYACVMVLAGALGGGLVVLTWG